MKEPELINMARAYVALSNAHRPALIQPLLAEEVTYHSARVGQFEGKGAIIEMMADFFTRLPDVNWNILQYRCEGPKTVEFEFVMTATERSTREKISRKGTERIEYTDEGLICSLHVD